MSEGADHLAEWRQGEFLISTDRRRLDIDTIHGFLVTSSWAAGIARDLVVRSIESSLPFGLYHGDRQIGFARVTTDYTTFAYLADVFVIEAYRGRKLGRWLTESVMAHPDLQGLRRWLLATSTAPWLYEKLGWTFLKRPEIFMELYDPDVYRRGGEKR
ncbi:GNAT family N-acetyltransferase [Sorangium sp. So ce1097]|uniref:GNAT family N-acetyltransferase n=1 Tax=Sorangium sp. So ce1097 TaxID=3133330 RepID=UPI003F5EA3B1